MSASASPRNWAVLIGIDYYEIRPLQGCVSDVEHVERMLNDILDPMRLMVEKITAKAANEPDPPTYSKVMGALQRVKEKAAPGDFFYFHYSGHGCRQLRKDDLKHPLGHSNGGQLMYEVLVFHGRKHLKDYELGAFLDSLANAGVRTFVVLDCCHSGGADRGGQDGISQNTIRGLDGILPPDEDEIAPPGEDDVLFDRDEIHSTTHQPTRDASARASYWVRARNYTLLAACQPHELAWECKDQSGERHGALTYTMLNSMAKLAVKGEVPTYKTLYWDVLGNITSVSPTQHPMLFGHQDLHIFRSTSHQSTRIAVINEISGGRVYINNGKVHGVHVGDEYAIHLRGSFDLSQVIAKIKIDDVDGTNASGEMPPVLGVEQGCPVSLTTMAIADPLHVKVRSRELLLELQQKPQSRVRFHSDDSQDATHEILFRGQHQGIPKIVDSTKRPLPNCPSFPAGREAATSIYNFLQKFANYRMVEQLHNKKSHLDGTFAFQERDGIEQVFHGDSVNLILKNLKPQESAVSGNQALYFSVLNLRANWEVALVVPNKRHTYQSIEVQPGQTSDPYELVMTIPDRQVSELVDNFKVIVTTEPSRFDMLDTTGSGIRGDESCQVAQRLEDNLERAGDPGYHPSCRRGDWQTANLLIKTRRSPQEQNTGACDGP